MKVLYYLLILYLIVVLVRVFSTWFPAPYSGPLRRILDVCAALTDPILNPLRRAVPPVRRGVRGRLRGRVASPWTQTPSARGADARRDPACGYDGGRERFGTG